MKKNEDRCRNGFRIPSGCGYSEGKSVNAMSLTDCNRNHLPLSQFVAEHNSYLSSKLKRTGLGVKAELRSILNSVPEKCDATLTDPKKESDLLHSLNAMPLDVLSTYVRKHAEDLGAAHTALDQKRSDGVRKAWSKTERFVMQFDRFLNAYSGILDIVKTADAQYGGVAGSTLALLFSVGPHHEGHFGVWLTFARL